VIEFPWHHAKREYQLGYSLSLLALQSADPDNALSALDIARTGETVEYGDAPLMGYAMPNGWYLIVANKCDHRLLDAKLLQRVSETYRVIACSIEEHVMFSSAEEWQAGKQIWRAEHMGEDGPINLKTSGTLPPSFAAMEQEFKAKQEAEGGKDADVDYYFEIPLTAAQTIMGFKHDEEVPGVNPEEFELLSDSASTPAAKSRWKFWK